MTTINLTDVIQEAIERRAQWMLPAVIIQITDGQGPITSGGNGEFEALPQAMMTDISWCGRGREYSVVCELDRDVLDELAQYPEADLTAYAAELREQAR